MIFVLFLQWLVPIPVFRHLLLLLYIAKLVAGTIILTHFISIDVITQATNNLFDLISWLPHLLWVIFWVLTRKYNLLQSDWYQNNPIYEIFSTSKQPNHMSAPIHLIKCMGYFWGYTYFSILIPMTCGWYQILSEIHKCKEKGNQAKFWHNILQKFNTLLLLSMLTS